MLRRIARSRPTRVVLAAALATASLAYVTKPPAAQGGGDASRFTVVDCLLPGQVRKLGGQMTYLSPRMPVKATASECEIRGGEYVAYDRANYATALQVWMPRAEEGDAQAMTYVGEIFEKGLGREADPATAAGWYRKASDKGFVRASSNLAYLYEKGLGVPQDAVMALNLYRKSAGIVEDELTFASEVTAVRDEAQSQIDALAAQLEKQTQEAETLRTHLAGSQQQLRSRRSALDAAKQESEKLRVDLAAARRAASQPAGDTSATEQRARIEKLEAALRDRESQVAQQNDEILALERTASVREGELQKRLQAAAVQDATLRQQLGRQTTEVLSVRAQLAAAQERLVGTEQRERALSTQLAAERSAINQERARLAQAPASTSKPATPAEIERMRGMLQQREALLAEQSGLIASLQTQMKSHSQQVAQLKVQLAEQDKVRQAQTTEVQNVRAQLASVQQRLLQTQQRLADANATLQKERALVAQEREALDRRRNAASAGQLAEIQRLAREVSRREQQVIEQRAQIAALEAESLDFSEEIRRLKAAPQRTMVAAGAAGAGATPIMRGGSGLKLPKGLEVGNYHALIIGNNKYEYMPNLETAVNDAQSLDRVLRARYGFRTRVLVNATRAEILSALNEYRLNLKEKDNLLIYYAGHGELDERILRGYWLPVNARRDDSTEWISDRMITDQIGLMTARHVLVVADSCYSGVMTRSGALRLVGNGTESAEVKRLIKLARLPSRTVLSSGGDKPVLDTSGGSNSIFAAAFIDILNRNDAVLEASKIHHALFDPVRSAAARFNVEQSPRYSMLADAGHLNGEFLFVPRT